MVIHHRCIGWGCLTYAQQVGVIISIVAGFMLLATVFSCILGCMAISETHKARNKNRQALRASLQPQPIPSVSPLSYTPVQYPPAIQNSSVTGYSIPQNLPLQHIAWALPALPPGVRYARAPLYQTHVYVVPRQDPTGLPKRQDTQQHERNATQSHISESRPPWFKRMMHNQQSAGRASTIRSISSAEYLPSELSDHLKSIAMKGNGEEKQKEVTPPPISNRLPDEISSTASAKGVFVEQLGDMGAMEEKSNISSVNTTAATVHSDDFSLEEVRES